MDWQLSAIDWQLIIIGVAIVLLWSWRYIKYKYLKQKCTKPTVTKFFVMSLAVGTVVSSANLIRLTIVSKQLRELLGLETFIVWLGATAVVWLSLDEIKKAIR